MMNGEKQGSGATVGIVIVILVLIIAGIYFWQKSAKEKMNQENTIQNEESSADNTQSVASETADIGADLNATSFDEVDAGL